MKKIITLTTLFLFVCLNMQAQRYVTEIFDDITVTKDVTYGVNQTILFFAITGQAVPQELKMDVYEPTNDSETDRPVIVMLHSGNFLPPSVNGGCVGTKEDGYLVEIAERLAKRGYVVCSADYRLGWRPDASDQNDRVSTLINAAYRGVQDARTCARYLRRTIVEDNNPYNISNDNISVWGIGTGGYIALATATLDTITDTFLPKFFDTRFSRPMVLEEVNGDVNGETFGIIPPGTLGFPAAGDTLCTPSHTGLNLSSDFTFAVNMGGSLGDTTWIDTGDIPILSYHVPTDPFAPCEIATVRVPPPLDLAVVQVMGSCTVHPILGRNGNNSVVNDSTYTDGVSTVAASRTGGLQSFLPFPSNDPTEASPWEWHENSNPNNVTLMDGSMPDCDVDSTGARMYADSILNFFIPRSCFIQGLGCDLSTSTRETVIRNYQLSAVPNPAFDEVTFTSEVDDLMIDIEMYDISGRLVQSIYGIDTNQYRFQRGNILKGIYIAKVRFKEGVVSKKIIFN